MDDLLKEFQKGAVKQPGTRNTNDMADNDRVSLIQGSSSSSTTELARASLSQASQAMQDFFGNVECIKKHIHTIASTAMKINSINQSFSTATTSEAEQAFSAQSAAAVAACSKKAQIAKQMLQRLREDNERLKTSKDTQQSELRIRENLTNTLTRKFVDVMKEYQNAQQQFKQDIKKKVTRQIQIVQPEATTEDVDRIISSGGGSGEVFKKAILQGGANDSINNAFMNAKDKYQDVLALEKSVAELNQMFLDFAVLIEQQGEMLDQIEFQVKSASDFVDEGNVNMVSAVELQKSLRYKQLCCCLIALVIVGVIVLIIFLYTGGGK